MMSNFQQVRNEIIYEKYSNDDILKGFQNHFKSYSDFSEGKILDIGCGQSEYIIDLLKDNFTLFGLDENLQQLNFLRKRANVILENSEKKLVTIHDKFPSSKISNTKFEGVILNNFLHFFSPYELDEVVKNVHALLKNGSIVVIKVHSWKHTQNNFKSEQRYTYFKHYFKLRDIYKLFPKSIFEYLLIEHKFKLLDNNEIKVSNEWIKRILNEKGVFDEKLIIEKQNMQLEFVKSECSITVVLKRKG